MASEMKFEFPCGYKGEVKMGLGTLWGVLEMPSECPMHGKACPLRLPEPKTKQ